jgi:hypothetical protein
MEELKFSKPAVFTPVFESTIQSGHFVKVDIHDVVFYGQFIVTYL